MPLDTDVACADCSCCCCCCRTFHSAAGFPCASSGVGPPQVTILLDMDKIIRPFNATTGLVTVGASMDLYTLAWQVFEAANRTLPNLAFPYHAHLTVGGVFAVGAHGSNMRPGGHLVRGGLAVGDR
jgi:FAD/FMN-containing dehydrogenase